MSEVLKKITARAKKIRQAHPSKKWQDCIKQAAKELKKPGSKSGAKKPAAKKTAAKRTAPAGRQTGTSNTKKDVLRTAKLPGKRLSAEGNVYYERRRNRSDKAGSLAGAGVSLDSSIQRTIMKRRLRDKGVTLDSNIADSDLQKAYTKLTNRKVPSITAIRLKLKKGVAVEAIIASL